MVRAGPALNDNQRRIGAHDGTALRIRAARIRSKIVPVAVASVARVERRSPPRSSLLKRECVIRSATLRRTAIAARSAARAIALRFVE
jgi:hypothetical protein